MHIATIQPNQLSSDAEIIDVRNPDEFQHTHARGASNYPLPDLDPHAIMQSRSGSQDEPLYIICQMGMRSLHACQQFVACGYPNVVNVEGGTTLWEQQGLPVVHPSAASSSDGETAPKPTMAMDRQVRIAAGVFVLTGVTLSALVEPAWIGLVVAGLVGAGLTYSGVTNTCGMAQVLGKMPWNRIKTKPC